MLCETVRCLAIAITVTSALSGCAHRAGDAPLANRGKAGGGDVRAIDWQNRTYELGELGPVTVHDGRAEFGIDDDGKAVAVSEVHGAFAVEPALFADVDGDGVEDAIVLGVIATGGTGRFSQVQIFTARATKLVELGTIPGGDRGDGGIRRIAVEGNAVIVERNVLAEGDGTCCASGSRRERWIWRNGEMVDDSARDPAGRR